MDNQRTIAGDKDSTMNATIVNRGDGPKIAGTRITVYAVLEYLLAGWDRASIAIWLGISTSQVEAVECYVSENREQVMADYEKIMERIARGNPPELQAKFAASHEKLLRRREELRRTNGQRHDHARTAPGQ